MAEVVQGMQAEMRRAFDAEMRRAFDEHRDEQAVKTLALSAVTKQEAAELQAFDKAEFGHAERPAQKAAPFAREAAELQAFDEASTEEQRKAAELAVQEAQVQTASQRAKAFAKDRERANEQRLPFETPKLRGNELLQRLAPMAANVVTAKAIGRAGTGADKMRASGKGAKGIAQAVATRGAPARGVAPMAARVAAAEAKSGAGASAKGVALTSATRSATALSVATAWNDEASKARESSTATILHDIIAAVEQQNDRIRTFESSISYQVQLMGDQCTAFESSML